MLMSYLTCCDMIEKMSISLFDLDLNLDWVGLCRNLPDLDCKQIPFSEIRANHGKGNHPVKMSWAPSKRPSLCSCFYRQITHPRGSQAMAPPVNAHLLFLSLRFITTRNLLKMYRPLFREQIYENLVSEDIRTIYFWSWQHWLWTLLQDRSLLGKEELYIFQNKLFSFHPQETIKY